MSDHTFQNLLAAAQDDFYASMKSDLNPAPYMENSARRAVEALSDIELATVLSTRPQTFSKVIEKDIYIGRDTLRSIAETALVEQIIMCFDLTGLDVTSVSKWRYEWSYGTPAYVRQKLEKFLVRRPSIVTVTADRITQMT